MIWNFTILGDKLSLSEQISGKSGNVNSYECDFDIDDTDLVWICVFKKGENTYLKTITNGKCVIPYEVLEKDGMMQIGCFGESMTENFMRVSTNWVHIMVMDGAYCEGTEPEIPEPDVWHELVLKSVPQIGENGHWLIYDMELGSYYDTGMDSHGYTPQKGVDYWTAADIAAMESDMADSFVEKQENLGLSDTFDIRFDNVYPHDYDTFVARKYDGSIMSENVYNKTQSDAKFEKKTNIVSNGPDLAADITAQNGTQYRYGTWLSRLDISLPDEIPEDFAFEVIFKSGTFETIFSCDERVIFVGDDCNAQGQFTPAPSANYEISFRRVDAAVSASPSSVEIVARVGAY